MHFSDIFLPNLSSTWSYSLWKLGILPLCYYILFAHLYYNNNHNSTLLQVSVCTTCQEMLNHLKIIPSINHKACCWYYSAAQSCPAICDPMDCSTPGFPVLHHLPEPAQTHVHWVIDAIQPSQPLLSPFPSCPQSFPASGSFPMSQLFTSGGQSLGTSASASVLPMHIQVWFPLGVTGLISLPSKSLLLHHSSIASMLQCSAFLMVQPLYPHVTTGKTTALTIWTFVGKVMSLLLNMMSRLVKAFLPRRKYLLISWLQSPSTVILEPKKIKLSLLPLFPLLFAILKWWDQMPWT